MRFSSNVIVHAPLAAVWAAVKDVRRVAAALPNAQLESVASDGTAAARMKFKVGPDERLLSGYREGDRDR